MSLNTFQIYKQQIYALSNELLLIIIIDNNIFGDLMHFYDKLMNKHRA